MPLMDERVKGPDANTPEATLRNPPGQWTGNIETPPGFTQPGQTRWTDRPDSTLYLRTPTLPQGAPRSPASPVEGPMNRIHHAAYNPGDMAAMQGLPPGTQWLLQQIQAMQQPPSFVVGQPSGLKMQGNIDLNTRPQVRNPDGSISTVRTITITTPHGAILLPTVINGRVVSNEEAIRYWQQTGQHLGIFDTEDNANAYAQALHESQAQQYTP